MALSGHTETIVCLSAFGAKRTWGAGRSRSSPPLLTPSGHSRDRNSAAQQSPALVSCAILSAAQVAARSPLRFRTIQVWPKDLPAALRQAEVR
jgi:hypothetical protein